MSQWLINRFSDYAKRPFLATVEKTYSYSDLSSAVASDFDSLRKQGIRAGEVVTLQADYSLQGISTLFALFKLKAVVAPIACASDEETRRKQIESRAKWNIDTKNDERQCTSLPCELPPYSLVEKLSKRDHPGLILFSSGSTGKPKAMVHDLCHLLDPFSRKRPRKHCILIFLLFDHIGGLNTLFNGLASGAKIVVPQSRDATVVAEAIQKHKVNLLPASPTFLNLLLISGALLTYDLSSLRFVTYGTETMPESLLLRLKTALPNLALIQTFGTSETGISQTTSRSSGSTQMKIDDPNTEYKIVDHELWLRSKSQILGYLNHSMSRFTEDGWFKTGDLVEESTDGFLTIIGRREDMINVGGEKVTPTEIESVLLELPEIVDCLVYGESNAITGQNVAAEIVARSTDDLKSLKRMIKRHCRQVLSPYKVPARIIFSEQTAVSDRFKKKRIK